MSRLAQLAVTAVVVFCSISLWAANDDGYALLPGPAITVTVDQPLNLKIVSIALDGSIHEIDLLERVEWTMNGKLPGSDPSEGTLTVPLGFIRATYTAPHTVPKVNPVAVAVSVMPQGPIKSKLTFICNITVVDRINVFSVTGPHAGIGIYQLDDRYSMPQVRAMLARAYMAGPELAVTVSAMQPGGPGGGELYHGNGSMSVFVNGNTVGEHPWQLPQNGGTSGPGSTTVMLTIAGASGVEMYSTADCLPHGDNHCDAVSTKGVTRITAFDAKTNEVSGTFEGQVVKLTDGRPSTYAQASGSFKTTLQGLVPGMK